jgi:hypothetical protein
MITARPKIDRQVRTEYIKLTSNMETHTVGQEREKGEAAKGNIVGVEQTNLQTLKRSSLDPRRNRRCNDLGVIKAIWVEKKARTLKEDTQGL